MTIEELIIYGKKYLHTTNVKMILANILGYDSLELLNHLNEVPKEEEIKLFKDYIDATRNNKPIQYLLGSVNFYGYDFHINEDVLIPRFETEELVENTLLFIKNKFKKDSLRLIDLGTGSGIIGITLKKKIPTLDVTLLDISEKALGVAKENARHLGVDVVVITGDMLEDINTKYDIIISNPPYIKDDEEIQSIVKDNEPHIALYGGKQGLDYYIKILKRAKNNLNDTFLLAFEIGRSQKDEIITIAKNYFPDAVIECKKDLSDNDRMIFIYKI